MGLKYAGWVCGIIILCLCALVTSWTAKILARCMDLDPTMITFSDIAYVSFGKKARIVTSVLFTLELLAACVALIVLFADSLALLFPGTLTVVGWKIICALILIPLQFAPLSILSFTSFIGIVCNFCSRFFSTTQLIREANAGFSCHSCVLVRVFEAKCSWVTSRTGYDVSLPR